jgi:anti-sigma28 factor (negative regulator of flagellin synthesis)
MFTIFNERKQAKMQWLQDPDQSNTDNEKNIRREASRKFRNKKLEYLKAKIVHLKRWNSLNILEQT